MLTLTTLLTSLATLSTLSTLTHAAPTTPLAPQPLGISLSTDRFCSTLTSGTPTSLVNGTCYPVPSGFSSMEVYGPSTQGLLTVYATGECMEGEDTQYFSAEYRGCMGLEKVGRGVKFSAVV